MKIETTINDNHEAELVVNLEQEVLETAKKKAARKIAKKIKVAGFRPGKAPYPVILQQVGEAAIVEEALDIIIDEYYPKIIEEAKLDPYGPGSLKDVPSLEPPTLEITVPLAPQVDIKDYQAIRVPYKPKKVTKKDINKILEDYRDKQAVIEPVERNVEEGDLVNVTISATRVEPKEGESVNLIEDRSVPIVVEKEDTNADDEWPFPGYSRKLIGKKKDGNFSATYTFKKDYAQEDLRGVKAKFQTEIKDVKGRSLPEMNDEFAKSAGDYDTLKDMTEGIKKSLTTKFEEESNAEYDNKIIDKILKETTFKITAQMIEHEIEHQINDLSRNLQSQGLDFDVYLKSSDLDLDGFKDDIRPAAVDRIQRGLILSEIAKTEKIEVTTETVEKRTTEMIESIRKIFPPDDAKKMLTKEYVQNLSRNIINDEITNQTLEILRKIAKGELAAKETEVKKDKKEVIEKSDSKDSSEKTEKE